MQSSGRGALWILLLDHHLEVIFVIKVGQAEERERDARSHAERSGVQIQLVLRTLLTLGVWLVIKNPDLVSANL
jgi:hypothetical protein